MWYILQYCPYEALIPLLTIDLEASYENRFIIECFSSSFVITLFIIIGAVVIISILIVIIYCCCSILLLVVLIFITFTAIATATGATSTTCNRHYYCYHIIIINWINIIALAVVAVAVQEEHTSPRLAYFSPSLSARAPSLSPPPAAPKGQRHEARPEVSK